VTSQHRAPSAACNRFMSAGAAAAARARRILVDDASSVGARKRAQRWSLFTRLFPDIETMRVLDLGGTTETWRRADVRPTHVTVLNLFEPGESDDAWLLSVTGDACTARADLSTAGAGTSYDLVFSNSLLEHVGGHAPRLALAREVRALAPRYWVQTPYRYFPIEPHWLCPGLQFLPMSARCQVAARWPLVHTRPTSVVDAMADVQATELVGIAELRAYFPGATVHKEKMAGLTKSLIAISRG
jgi:hypothetical protein